MNRSKTLALATLLAPLMACGDDDSSGPSAAKCTDNTGLVSLSVSSGAQPVFNWDPACTVAMLLAEEEASDQLRTAFGASRIYAFSRSMRSLSEPRRTPGRTSVRSGYCGAQ